MFNRDVAVVGQMKAVIGIIRTASANYQVACTVIYADGRTEEHRGKVFATIEEAEENADRLTEALRETQQVANRKLS